MVLELWNLSTGALVCIIEGHKDWQKKCSYFKSLPMTLRRGRGSWALKLVIYLIIEVRFKFKLFSLKNVLEG